jgi:hypothetical protein
VPGPGPLADEVENGAPARQTAEEQLADPVTGAHPPPFDHEVLGGDPIAGLGQPGPQAVTKGQELTQVRDRQGIEPVGDDQLDVVTAGLILAEGLDHPERGLIQDLPTGRVQDVIPTVPGAGG